jgi:hypothetical protein
LYLKILENFKKAVLYPLMIVQLWNRLLSRVLLSKVVDKIL